MDEDLPNVDVDAKLPIITKENWNAYSKLLNNGIFNSGHVRQIDVEKAMKRAPVAIVRDIDDFEPFGYFERDSVYFRSSYNSEITENNIVDYELDSDDEEWLSDYNEDKCILKENVMEEVLDILEKKAFSNSQDSLTSSVSESILETLESLQDSDCCVCLDGYSEDVNRIVFCDGCNMGVHQCCYGLPSIPQGVWHCRRCSEHLKIDNTKCVFCHQTSGAMRQTVHGNWGHIQCGLFLDGISFTEPNCGGEIEYRKSLKKYQSDTPCMVCSKTGFMLQCNNEYCNKTFHVTCGQREKFVILLDDTSTVCWCAKHTPNIYEEYRGGLIQKDEEEKKERKKKEKKLRALLKLRNRRPLEKSYPLYAELDREIPKFLKIKGERGPEYLKFCGGLSLDDAFKHLKDLSQIDSRIKTDLYKHWAVKRIHRRGLPILRELQPSTAQANEEVPIHHFTKQEKITIVEKMISELTEIRKVIGLIQKREEVKLLLHINDRNRFEELLKPNSSDARELIETISREDSQHLLAIPASPRGSEEYLTTVKTPISLNSIEDKLNRNRYPNTQQLKDDINRNTENEEAIDSIKAIVDKTTWFRFCKYSEQYNPSLFLPEDGDDSDSESDSIGSGQMKRQNKPSPLSHKTEQTEKPSLRQRKENTHSYSKYQCYGNHRLPTQKNISQNWDHSEAKKRS
eukprot:TRINITY_DN2611_c0_g1_i1.p1 TRINITY_DN2611_c0_g1~~TRINITY_DN2611_c0_g1_i1.p1  ORF type:complete len:683 (+),score=130.99 TRINITY_DN2611_c0_g1_i1:37-2085(+)